MNNLFTQYCPLRDGGKTFVICEKKKKGKRKRKKKNLHRFCEQKEKERVVDISSPRSDGN